MTTTTADRELGLGRLEQFDERSRAFNIREILAEPTPRSYTWACNSNLDQGSEGACVGFSWAHEANAKPRPNQLYGLDAIGLYRTARTLDVWPGEDYSGTSVLAGAKAMQAAGLLKEYRWAFNLNDALTAISRHGPAVLGVDWYSGMFDTDSAGFIRPTGSVVGGHAILARGVNVPAKTVLLHNSWGSDWGGTKYGPGTALMTWADLQILLNSQGEVCIPVLRG